MLISNNIANNSLGVKNPYRDKRFPAQNSYTNQVSFGAVKTGGLKIGSAFLFLSMLMNGLPVNASSSNKPAQTVMSRDSDNVFTINLRDYSTTRAESRRYEVKTHLESIASKLYLFPKEKLPPKFQTGWDKNIRVLTSNAQHEIGVTTIDYSYLKSLAQLLAEPGRFNTIEEANNHLVHSGYKSVAEEFVKSQEEQKKLVENARKQSSENEPIEDFSKSRKIPEKDKKYLTTYYPFKTKGESLGIFNKKEHHKQRFVLALSCEEEKDNSGSYLYKKISNSFVDTIKKLYKIPENNIIRVTTTTPEDFINSLDLIARKIRIEKQNNAELVVLYTGDGLSVDPCLLKSYCEWVKYKQGAMNGSISMNNITGASLSETEMKAAFNKTLRGIKTIFIVNACDSASLIAEPVTKNPNSVARGIGHFFRNLFLHLKSL